MKLQELMHSRRYAEAIAELERFLEKNPEDMSAVERMAKMLKVNMEYQKALFFFERLAQYENNRKTANTLAPGRAAWQIEVACLYWLTDDHLKATSLMHGLAAGIYDGSIKYADAAGGMSNGLLLYYMAVSEKLNDETSFALRYLNDRLTKVGFSKVWPCPVAQNYLEEIKFETVLEAVNRQPASPLLDKAKAELGRRRRLTVALFHDGVKRRAQGDEETCLARMRECCGLENPLLEQEWYLARYEVQRVHNRNYSFPGMA